ncbi:TPA: hypothetical protein DCQ19_03605, partial [Candidatus Shapirobacteria bacterium]|nr:hypothetical protein [Candidatus Shapirobacteria bacterium]
MPTTNSLDFTKIKQSLVNLAKKQHYLTHDEILEKIPSPQKYIEEIDKLFDYLFGKGIDIFDKINADEIV